MRSTAIVLTLLVGCVGSAAGVPVLMPHADEVRVGKSDPDPACRDLGPIEVANGGGCGGFGNVGTYEGAYTVLRNQAWSRGANYVRMDSQAPPHSENGCYEDAYAIRGVAFACTATAPSAPPAP